MLQWGVTGRATLIERNSNKKNQFIRSRSDTVENATAMYFRIISITAFFSIASCWILISIYIYFFRRLFILHCVLLIGVVMFMFSQANEYAENS